MKHLNEDSEDKVIYNKLKVLLDSGASNSIVYKNRLPQAIAATLKRKQNQPSGSKTQAHLQQINKLHLHLNWWNFQLSLSFDGR